MAELGMTCSMLKVADILSYATEEALNSFPDVFLISNDGEVLCANRCSLSSSSDFLGHLFRDLESSGLLATETEIYISTEINSNNLNAILDFVTTGLIHLPPGPPPDEICFDEEFKSDLFSMGIELPMLSLSLSVSDEPRRDHRRDETSSRGFHLVSDQSRTRSLDGDILGLALGEVGLEQQGGVQVVCEDGSPVIVEHEGVVTFVANPGDECMDAGPSHRFIGPQYSAGSAKMRRVWKNSRLVPYRKMSEFEPKPRGRPRKDMTLSTKKKSFTSTDFRTGEEKENGDRQDVIERPGRRTVKRPRRFDDMCLDRVKTDDLDLNHDEVSDPSLVLDSYGRSRVTRGKPKLHRSRASEISANTCVACGKVCKSSYLFKIHLKNYGPFHDNTCAICNAEFKSWEEHISHLREFHNGQFKYKCGICREVFDTEERQRIHRHEIHTRKDKSKTACEQCGKVVIDYAAHQENFHGTEQHPCPQCPKIFGHVAALRRHVKDNHRQFPCEHCGNIMKNFKKYRLHILSIHTPDSLKPYQCSICTPVRGFPTKWNLFEHMNKHNNTRPFKCKTCPATFATTSSRCHHEKACGAGNKGGKPKDDMQTYEAEEVA